MRVSRAFRRFLASGCVACAVLAAGCGRQVAGRGSLAEEALAPTSTAAPTINAPPGTIHEEWAGTWSGLMDQPDEAVPHWQMVVTLFKGTLSGTLSGGYCRGSVAVVQLSKTRLAARVAVDFDPLGICSASGTLTLQPSGINLVSARWVGRTGKVSTGTLRLR